MSRPLAAKFMPKFTVSYLKLEQLGEAYPLIRSAARVTKEQWLAFARQARENCGEVLAVFAEDGHIHGVAVYFAISSLRHGPALMVEVIASFELTRGRPARKALCLALVEAAKVRGCKSLVLVVKPWERGDRTLASSRNWEDLGFELETVRICQPLSQFA